MKKVFLSITLFLSLLVSSAQVNPVVMGTENQGGHFKIVIVAEGYTSSELSKFDTDADVVKNAITTLAPFSSNVSKINFYKVRQASVQSGQSVDGGITVNTYWKVFSNKYGLPRFLGIPTTERNLVESAYGNMSNGNRVFVILLCNKNSYAGSGDLPSYPYWSSKNTSLAIVNSNGASNLKFLTIHEFCGHAFGDLDDEYVDSIYANSGDPFLLHGDRLNTKTTNPGGWLSGARYVTTKYRYGNDLMRSATWTFHSRNEGLVQDRIDAEVSTGTLIEFNGASYTSSSSACNSPAKAKRNRYHNGANVLPVTGDYIFIDNDMTLPLNGSSKWWRNWSSTYTIKVSSTGKVLSTNLCL